MKNIKEIIDNSGDKKPLKYELGFSFKVSQDTNTRDGFVKKGTQAFIEEISESEYNRDGIKTPYRIFFDKCVVGDNDELLTDDEGKEIGGSDWFSAEDIESIISLE